MQKILSVTFMLMWCVGALLAQGPVIEFERTEHDFGTIKEDDGRVSTDFVFKNTGMAPLVLSNVRASCGCTTPNWPKDPIEPGQTGTITVTYNATGRPGRFQKTITVTSNASEETVRLFIKGDVTPKASSAKAIYPAKIGNIGLKSKRVDFSSVTQGAIISKKVEMYNYAVTDVTVTLKCSIADAIVVETVTIPAGQVGYPEVRVNTGKLKIGILDIPVKLVVNGQEEKEDLIAHVDISQDFSSMSTEAKQVAPKIEVVRNFDMGKIKAGASVTKNLSVSNVGAGNSLIIQQVYSSNANIQAEVVKSNIIKSGKKGEIKISVSTTVDDKPMEAGVYHKPIVIICDDPGSPQTTVDIEFTVE